MISIYSSGYNLHSMNFSWERTLTFWLAFLGGGGEICIAVNTSTDNTANRIRDFFKKYQQINQWCSTKTKVIDAAIPYTDREFDGKLKALALSHCMGSYAILLDMDEIIPVRQKKMWSSMARQLENQRGIDGLMIPVVDLIGDDQHFKLPLGTKWYLHRNTPNITRGVVGFARREDGTFDTSRSDSCEAIYKDTGELIRSAPIQVPQYPDFLKVSGLEMGETPYVVHLGWLDLEQRLKQTEFWKGHWENREGKPGCQPKTSLEDLKKIKRYEHNLPDWRTIT